MAIVDRKVCTLENGLNKLPCLKKGEYIGSGAMMMTHICLRSNIHRNYFFIMQNYTVYRPTQIEIL